MLSSKITVCIFVWNEEKRILPCLENFKGLFNIVVVDNCSTDQTVRLAQEAGCRTITVQNPGFIETPEVMNKVLAACDTDYVLIALVGEYVPISLLRLYADVANEARYEIVRTYRVSITAGRAIRISGRPSIGDPGQLRFFRKGSISYDGNPVHGTGIPMVAENRILSLVPQEEYHFFQFRDYDCARTEEVMCRYDDILAEQRFMAGDRFRLTFAVWRACVAFINCYFRFGAYKFGVLGLLHSYYRFHMEFSVWLRVWEHQNGFTLADVRRLNQAVRKKMETADRSQ